MNKKLSYFLAAVVIATAAYFFKKPSKINTEDVSKEDTSVILPDNTPTVTDKKESSSASVDQNVSEAAKAVRGAQEETREQKLIKEGYVQDPDNADRMMKRYPKDKNGVSRVVYMDKVEESFEPDARTAKNALEVLESKKNTDPFEEVRTLGRINEKNINNAMLNGYFRDDANDIECNFASVTDEKGEPSEYDKACFVAPKLGLNFSKAYDNYTVNTDETGYAIIKFSPTKFIRFTWSYENRRAIHGDVVSIENGQSTIIKNFTAKEVRSAEHDQLKYCK